MPPDRRSLVKRISSSLSESTRNASKIYFRFCIIGIATSKASASVFLLRLAVVEWHKWILYITMFAVTGIAVICALFDFIRCDPIAHVWNPYIPAKCWVSTEQFTAISITVGSEWHDSRFHPAILANTLKSPRQQQI